MTALALLLVTPALGGCVFAAAAGAGAGAVTVATQERGAGQVATDTAIRAEINHLWAEKHASFFSDLNLQVVEARVLISGNVTKEDLRADAVALAWKAEGVKEVINEIEIKPEGTGIGTYAKDSAIITELNSRLLFDQNIASRNYSIEVVDGVVYLLGIAQSAEEMSRVVNVARGINNVRKVVNHVLLKDDPRRKATAPS